MTDEPASPFDNFPDHDTDWLDSHWKALLEHLVSERLVTWHQACALVLGHLNPSQVGTSIASKRSFQEHFPRRETWKAVRQWHFNQPGTCNDCGTRLELQADHMVSKEIVGRVGKEIADSWAGGRSALLSRIDERLATEIKGSSTDADMISTSLRQAIAEALCDMILAGERDQSTLANVSDTLHNIVLRCRRCNVIRRPSHKHGGKTFLTTEAALMWILVVKRPSTYEEFNDHCRSYGMTMADIRFEEAWAMAIWLARDGRYLIDPLSKYN